MQIKSIYSYPIYNTLANTRTPSFAAAKDINLEYLYNNRFENLPKRMQDEVSYRVKNNKNVDEPLRDVHLKMYSALNDCTSLEQAQNIYPEFREVLQLSAVVKHKSPNVKKIMENTKLEDFSLYVLKARWGQLKTLDEIAKELGLKDRSAIAWFLDKIQMPDFGKNYMALLRASDEAMNNEIAEKVRNYNSLHREEIVEKNRRISAETIDIQRDICQIAWDRLPHIKEAFSEISTRTNKYERFSVFWATYPEYAKEFADMKRIVAKELRIEREKNKKQ